MENNSSKVILHLCADTGSDSQPYKEAGYTVIRIGKDVGVENYHPPENVHGIIANPVCTEFSTAAQDNGIQKKKRERNFEEGLFLVKECQRIITEASPKWWAIENPAKGTLKKYLGTPRLTYEPWEYGSPWSKSQSLWGDFVLPPKLYSCWEDVPNKIPELYIRPNRQKPSLAFMHKSSYDLILEFCKLKRPETDMEFRSFCSQKFVQAFFEANQ